jgi:hypothetical protein
MTHPESLDILETTFNTHDYNQRGNNLDCAEIAGTLITKTAMARNPTLCLFQILMQRKENRSSGRRSQICYHVSITGPFVDHTDALSPTPGSNLR